VLILDDILTLGLLLVPCINTDELEVHPFASVTNTVYVVSTPKPITVGFDTVVEDKSTAGDQLYVYAGVPPLAVGLPPICIPVGLQLDTVLVEPALAVGVGLTTTLVVAVAEHPLWSDTVKL